MADADITLPSFIIEAGTGATADITLIPFVISSATCPGASMTLPLLMCEGHARTGFTAEMTLPSLEVEAFGGAAGEMVLPEFTVEATALVGAICSADIELPNLTISTYTSTPNIGIVDLSLPRMAVRGTSIHDILAAGDMQLALFLVSGTVKASGVVTGYAINLKTLGLSEYENFTFNSMCRIGNLSFGASSSGLYRLDSGDDSGTNIVAYATFPLCDFGVDNKKRVRSVYYGGTASRPLRLYTENDEGNERRRLFEPKDVRSKTKIPVGREGKGSYWKFKIINVRGADFEMDTLEMFPVVLGRV